jgi:hypothetical protein
MSIEATTRQYFRDFLENLGDHEYGYEEYSEEEGDQIITAAFFFGGLIIRWNPKKHTLMLKIITKKDGDS